MASFYMHIAISKCIQEKLELGNEFILGAILPDLYKLVLKDRDLTHFQKDGLPDINNFCNTYKNNKTEIAYGYLAHLVEDRIWFSKYGQYRHAQLLEDGMHWKYKKDNTIHTNEEIVNEFYRDYARVEEYVIKKYNLNRKELRNKFKESIFKNKNIISKDELINLVDEKIIDYTKIYDITGENCFLSQGEVDSYFEDAINETERILKQFMVK